MLVLVLALLTKSTTVDALAAQQRWWAPAADVHATLRVEDAYVSLNGAGSIRSLIFGVTAYEGGSVFDCPEKDVCPVGCTCLMSRHQSCSRRHSARRRHSAPAKRASHVGQEGLWN
eukprot:COSAG03_NODE_10750_length_630_cov_1.830508_1_plen_116_part_00